MALQDYHLKRLKELLPHYRKSTQGANNPSEKLRQLVRDRAARFNGGSLDDDAEKQLDEFFRDHGI